MKGDFSRVTFDPRHHYSQVLLQQGRVTLDADPNEQGAILLHLIRTLARDVFGPYAAPAEAPGFELDLQQQDGKRTLTIGAGRYYVDGILCESEGCDYLQQPHFAPASGDAAGNADPLRTWLESGSERDDARFWVYLDVWERHLTAVEAPHLREVALGGPDTCSRRQVVWQVRAIASAAARKRLQQRRDVVEKWLNASNDDAERARLAGELARLDAALADPDGQETLSCDAPLLLFERRVPELVAWLPPSEQVDDPCVTSPDSAYRGAENHLYRVEIHQGSEAGGHPTFKWSRDNGSVLTRWTGGAGDRIEVTDARGFRDGQWIELSDEQDDLLNRPGQLVRIASVEGNVLLLNQPQARVPGAAGKVRSWDHVEAGDVVLAEDGAIPVPATSATDEGWIALEDGIEIRFAADRDYRTGDYWLIAARVATGDIEWPSVDGQPQLQPPAGVAHHYAPLGFVGGLDGNANGVAVTSCGCVFTPPRSCEGPASARAATELRAGAERIAPARSATGAAKAAAGKTTAGGRKKKDA